MIYKPYWLYIKRIKTPGFYSISPAESGEEKKKTMGLEDSHVKEFEPQDLLAVSQAPLEPEPVSADPTFFQALNDQVQAELPQTETPGLTKEPRVQQEEPLIYVANFKQVAPGVFHFKHAPAETPSVNYRPTGQRKSPGVQSMLKTPELVTFVRMKSEAASDYQDIPVYSFG